MKEQQEEKLRKWKCERCGDITLEAKASMTDSYNQPMPEGGWACLKIKCGMQGRRILCRKSQ